MQRPLLSPLDAREEAIATFHDWRAQTLQSSGFACEPIRFDQSLEWRFADGILRHKTGGFFSVAGLVAQARDPRLNGREQAILLQIQPAINGFLLRRVDGRAELLFQGRVEPGNVGVMQLAPTVQSTTANYLRWHGGRATPFLEWFVQPNSGRVRLDDLQSEEGSRYHGKYNRNVVVELPDDIDLEVPAAFRWYGLAALRSFARESNLLNTDSRALLACLNWDLLAEDGAAFAGHAPKSFGSFLRQSYLAADVPGDDAVVQVLKWLARIRVECALTARVVPIPELKNWAVDEAAIREKQKDVGFAVRQFAVRAPEREVLSWDQPLVDSHGTGRVALVCQRRDGVLRFLLQASPEIGYLEGLQLSTSICVPPGEELNLNDPVQRALADRIDAADLAQVVLECRQSEEGGRFYQDENRYQIVELSEETELPASEFYRWVTLGQVRQLIAIPGTLTIELRAALALLLCYA